MNFLIDLLFMSKLNLFHHLLLTTVKTTYATLLKFKLLYKMKILYSKNKNELLIYRVSHYGHAIFQGCI